jgi:hypothetical protein
MRGDRFDQSGCDEVAQRGLWDAHVTTDADEGDAPFFDQPTRESRCGAENLCGLGRG